MNNCVHFNKLIINTLGKQDIFQEINNVLKGFPYREIGLLSLLTQPELVSFRIKNL